MNIELEAALRKLVANTLNQKQTMIKSIRGLRSTVAYLRKIAQDDTGSDPKKRNEPVKSGDGGKWTNWSGAGIFVRTVDTLASNIEADV